MALDAATLALTAAELKTTLADAKIAKLFEPTRDELVITLRTRTETYSLLLSARSGSARVCLTEESFENPETPPSFCMLMRKHLTGGRLLDVRMEPSDRIVYFEFQCTNEMGDLVRNILCAELMGRYSNLVLVQNGKIIDALKRVDFEDSDVRQLLPGPVRYFDITLCAGDRSIDDLIPNFYRKGKKDKKRLYHHLDYSGAPWVSCTSRPYDITRGLAGRHIALWQSHGKYYINRKDQWGWQRPRLFCTTEDQFTQSFVLPYLIPMLEHAGACVYTPRERDTQFHEVIVDNDGFPTATRSIYLEEKSRKARWQDAPQRGFAQRKTVYQNGENPFTDGTARFARTEKKKEKAFAEWIPDIPETGEYAVYVSYQTLPQSVSDAKYLVFHNGGVTEFKVNQQMGGGTWIYLGTFGFNAGRNNECKVVLSNLSSKVGRIITADAVKIGGGMGNIARRISNEGATENLKSSDARNLQNTHTGNIQDRVTYSPLSTINYQLSNYPRFCEAARYWLQWAGIPDSVYSESNGKNDYTDDYKCRGIWVNYLSGGSAVNPTERGLNIPVNMAFAFHSDAGTTLNDSIIGTLGIYHTNAYNEKFANGASRYLSHDLTDLIQSNIVRDVRTLYEPQWTRRGKWNQSYYEARVPRVPTMLLELLSHQNFADMRYGLDPRFRFTVSRAIYKGMLQFLCSQYHMDYVVQPLPVDHMALRMTSENEVELTWQPVADALEPTAVAEKYIVYTRIGDGDFDNGVLVDGNSYRTTLPAGMVCSYKVTAVNKGGESFPSEILSAGRAFNSKGTVLVINGFDRISAPADFTAPTPADTLLAGFLDEQDHGVPYIRDISYIGKMKEYRRSIPWMDDDASGFGDSYGNYETQVIAGNTFDYPAIHGAAILKAGYSFVSCSNESLSPNPSPVGRGDKNTSVDMKEYRYVDLILGKQCQTKMGRGGVKPLEFKTFSKPMQEAIVAYCKQGGNIFVSGAFVGTDLWDNRLATADEADKKFAMEVLKYKWRVGQAATMGKVKSVASPFPALSGNYTYHNELNADSYVVESPDAIEPATKDAHTVMRYSENNLSAGVAYQGDYKTFVLGFPFESIRTDSEREALMNAVLTFFNDNK